MALTHFKGLSIGDDGDAFRAGLTGILTATASLDFGSTLTNASEDLTITVTGAALGDCVSLGIPEVSDTPEAGYHAWVSATDTVSVRFNNHDASTQDPAAGTFRVIVFRI